MLRQSEHRERMMEVSTGNHLKSPIRLHLSSSRFNYVTQASTERLRLHTPGTTRAVNVPGGQAYAPKRTRTDRNHSLPKTRGLRSSHYLIFRRCVLCRIPQSSAAVQPPNFSTQPPQAREHAASSPEWLLQALQARDGLLRDVVSVTSCIRRQNPSRRLRQTPPKARG
jgi:hypothetical protein